MKHKKAKFFSIFWCNLARQVWCSLCYEAVEVSLVLGAIQKMPGSPDGNLSPNKVELLRLSPRALTLIELCVKLSSAHIKPCRCSFLPSLCSGSSWLRQLCNKLRMPCSWKILWVYEYWGPKGFAIRLCTLRLETLVLFWIWGLHV